MLNTLLHKTKDVKSRFLSGKKVFCFYYILITIYCLPFTVAFSQTWHQLSGFTPYHPGVYGAVYALKSINGKLYIGGGFGGHGPFQPPPYSDEAPGGNGIATFDGTTWDSLGHGVDYGGALSIEYYNGGIYAGGNFSYANTGQYFPNSVVPNSAKIAKWNGTQWFAVDSTLSTAHEILALQYKNDLYIGGTFYDLPVSNGNAKGITRYNGSTMDNMQGGLDWGIGGNEVRSMVVWNGELYVAGAFNTAGGVPCHNIAKWNGTKWDSVGGGVDANGMIMKLVVDSVNNALYAVGGFESAGGMPAHGVAKWDGNNWSALGIPPQWYYGFGSAGWFKGELYVSGGSFGSPMDTVLIRWDGNKWNQVYGPNGFIFDFTVYKGNLYIGGNFTKIDTTTVNGIACYGDSCPGKLITMTLPYAVNELSNNSLKFKVYPNPAKNNITIETTEDKKFIVHITNPLGQQIITQSFQKKTEVDVSAFGKGLFLVEVCDEKEVKCHTEKVLVE